MAVLWKVLPYGIDQLMYQSQIGNELLDHLAYSVMDFNTSLNKWLFNGGLMFEICKLQPNAVTNIHGTSS